MSERTTPARRGLALFGALVTLLSAAVAMGMYLPHAHHGLLTVLLMWCPGVASILCRLVLREGFGDVSFRLGKVRGTRALAISYAVPLSIGLFAYGLAWATGLSKFTGPPSSFAARLLLVGTLGLVDHTLYALGEELGWRGYMLTRLVDAKVPAPLLSSGVIWAAWHVPFILGGGYSPALATRLGLLTFFACTIAAAVIAGVLRLNSGSVWPAVLFHATWNSFMQGAFDAFTEQPTLWLGESGVLVAGATGVAAAVVYWRWGRAASGFTTAGGNIPAPTVRHRRP